MSILKKEKPMKREDVAELYRDMRKTMAQLGPNAGGIKKQAAKPAQDNKALAQEIARTISQSLKKDEKKEAAPSVRAQQFMAEETKDALLRAQITGAKSDRSRGQSAAILLVLIVVVIKFAMTLAEGVGIVSATPVQAMVNATPKQLPAQRFSPDDIKILTSLEERRAELERRAEKVVSSEEDIARREREFVVRISELKDLTERLRGEREKDQKKRSAQIEQLSNVYGSMNPQEAAQLLQQLDLTIALSLIERMPEKRIGQILSLMTPDKALMLTKMLSGRARG